MWFPPNPNWDRFRVASRRDGVGLVGAYFIIGMGCRVVLLVWVFELFVLVFVLVFFVVGRGKVGGGCE